MFLMFTDWICRFQSLVLPPGGRTLSCIGVARMEGQVAANRSALQLTGLQIRISSIFIFV